MYPENIIKALEYCKRKDGNECKVCPYAESDFCVEDMITDAFALLKEQGEELSYRKAKAITHTATKLDDATCPSCGNVVGEKIRTGAIGQSVVQVQWDYCRFCGQKLDWEGR